MRRTIGWTLAVLGASSLATMAQAAGTAPDPIPAQAPRDARWRVDVSWPKALPEGWLIGDVGGVAVDSHNHVWIVQRPSTLRSSDVLAAADPPQAKCCQAAPPVLEFDTDGNLLRSWGGPELVAEWFDSEHSIYVDEDGMVWIVGAGTHDGQLLKFTPDGELLLRIGRKGEFVAADDPTMLGLPTDIAVDTAANEVYVSDGYRNKRVIVFDSETGAFKRQWTAYGKPVDPDYTSAAAEDGTDPGMRDTHLDRFTTVHCVVLVGGEVNVCDRANNRVQIFRPDGTFIREIFFNRHQSGPTGSAWDAVRVPGHDDRLLLVDGANGEFAMLDRNTGEVLSSYLSDGRWAGQLHWPHQGAIDQQGRIYLTEVGGAQRFQRFVPNPPLHASYITAEQIAAVEQAVPVGDRTVAVSDIGYENFALGMVHRNRTVNGRMEGPRQAIQLGEAMPCGRGSSEAEGQAYPGGIIHTRQTESYYITSGGGTMFTDGYIVEGSEYDLSELNGPTCLGTAYGVTVKTVKEGDVVIVPAGVVHGWIEIPDHVDYISFRPSPGVLEPGYIHPAAEAAAP